MQNFVVVANQIFRFAKHLKFCIAFLLFNFFPLRETLASVNFRFCFHRSAATQKRDRNPVYLENRALNSHCCRRTLSTFIVLKDVVLTSIITVVFRLSFKF